MGSADTWKVLGSIALTIAVGCGSGGDGSDSAAATPAPEQTPAANASPVAWAVGRGSISQLGLVLHSNDGGATWVRNFSDPDLRLGSVDFVDRDHGWLTGRSTEGPDILHTDDGGVSWKLQGRNFVGSTALPHLSDIAFMDRLHGAAVGFIPALGFKPPTTAILVTADGGVTWRAAEIIPPSDPVLLEQRLAQLCFTTMGIGLALGNPTASQPEPELLLITHDWGQTWQDIRSRVVGVLLTDIACAGEMDFWIAGFSRLDGQVISGTLLQHSSDAGETWQDVTDRLPVQDLAVAAAHFTTRTVGVLIMRRAPFRFVTLRTSDAGRSWTNQGTTRLGESFSPSALAFADDAHGVLVGTRLGAFLSAEGSMSFTTQDGGKTWTEVAPPGLFLGDVDIVR